MARMEHTFAHPPEAVWRACPAGFDAVKARHPRFDEQEHIAQGETTVSLWSLGHRVTVHVTAAPADGTIVTVRTLQRIGLLDLGVGRRICHKFLYALDQELGE